MKIFRMHKPVGLLTWFLLLLIPTFSIAGYESNTLAFFRALEEKDATAIKNPSTYDRLSTKISNSILKHYYVERIPAHVVPRTGIEVIKVVKSTPEVNDRTQKFFYSINFTIIPVEAKRFIAFVNRNKEGMFQVKVGDQSLGVAQFYWPFENDKNRANWNLLCFQEKTT